MVGTGSRDNEVPLIILSYSNAESINDNDQITLTCNDGPCNKVNLKGFECSYSISSDQNYNFVCISEDTNYFFDKYINLDQNYKYVKENFQKFMTIYLLLVTFLFGFMIKMKLFIKFTKYIVSL